MLLIFGSVLGAILPLVTALVSVLAGIGILGIVAGSLTFGTASPTLCAMIGIGVGIDYAVFLSTRYRQQIMDGADPVAAAGFCTTTSGRAVLVAASTVAVAMLGLYASGITFVGLLGLAAVFGVFTAAVGAVTLVPALLGLAGRNIDQLKIRKTPVAERGSSGDSWHRYAAMIGRHPWLFLLGGLSVLCVLAIPLLSIQTGHVGDGADPTSYTDRQAYDLISEGFGPGYNGPFTIVIDTGSNASADTSLASSVQSALAGTSRRRQGHATQPHARRRAAHRNRHPDHQPAGPGDHERCTTPWWIPRCPRRLRAPGIRGTSPAGRPCRSSSTRR